jgi:hypothetical protein
MSRLRLVRRLARKHRATNDTPPAQADGDATTKLKSAIAGLRSTARGDPATMEIVSEAERLIKSGWTERRGGGEATKPRPMLPEWKDSREPPERQAFRYLIQIKD